VRLCQGSESTQLRPSWLLLRLPILQPQPGHAAELTRVVRHEYQVVGQGDCGNQRIVRADPQTLCCEVGVDAPGDFCGRHIEGQAAEPPYKRIDLGEVVRDLQTAVCAPV
jgi:hypothetical protein